MPIDPVAHDTELDRLFGELDKARQTARYARESLLRHADAKFYYRGRRRVTDMTTDEAFEIVAAKAQEAQTYRGEEAAEAIEKHENAQLAIGSLVNQVEEHEEHYTGWSRFFLVTSSQGHIHRSMNCRTCYPSTTYGFLPHLSGKTEAEAVAQCGPNLCSDCFKSAPIEYVGGKLSQKQANAILKGEKFVAEPAKVYCPGSGKSALKNNWRYGYCPDCGKHVAVTQYGAARKHEARS